jgi:hypothetical protein
MNNSSASDESIHNKDNSASNSRKNSNSNNNSNNNNPANQQQQSQQQEPERRKGEVRGSSYNCEILSSEEIMKLNKEHNALNAREDQQGVGKSKFSS